MMTINRPRPSRQQPDRLADLLRRQPALTTSTRFPRGSAPYHRHARGGEYPHRLTRPHRPMAAAGIGRRNGQRSAVPATMRRPINTAPRFALGACRATPGAQAALRRTGIMPLSILRCHQAGDWGEIDTQDRQANEWALTHRAHLLSSYLLPDGTRLWAFTDAARSTTTLLADDADHRLSSTTA